jgi:Ca2+-binding RTX toxin-like protein
VKGNAVADILFIDTRVQDYELLLAGLAPGVQVVVLDPTQDGVVQIARALAGVSDLESVHIVSHGSQGRLLLGDTALTGQNIASYQDELSAIGAALAATGDILLYGCDVAAGEAGQALIDQLATLTRADVAASTDATGSAALGGDWVLEASSGEVAAALVVSAQAQQAYAASLDAITGTAGNDSSLPGTTGDDTISGLAGNDTLIGLAGNDLLDGGTGSDTAAYAGSLAGYSFGRSGSNFTVTDTDLGNGNEGVDTLADVENASFTGALLGFSGEFRVNTTTIDDQQGVVVTGLSGGGFVAVWQSYAQDGSGWGVYAQRYDSNGSALGGEFKVNQTSADQQAGPTVAALAGGGFVVAWHSNLQDTSGYGVYQQRYDANAVPLGPESRANSATASDQSDPAIAALSDGGYVLAWSSYAQDGSSYGIYAQRFGAGGLPAGAEFKVNSSTANEQTLPAIAGLSGGGFMVAWQSYGQDGNYDGIYAQRFDASGAPAGDEFKVNTTTLNYQSSPALAALANNAGYVVAWHSILQDGSSYGVYAQRYDAGGVAQGGEFLVNTTTANNQADPAIAALAAGGFVISWNDSLLDGSSWGVFAQRYGADGVALGGETRINSTTSSEQSLSSVAALADGGYLVSWRSYGQDGSGYGVYAQRYDASGNRILLQIGGDAGANTLVWTHASAIALSGGAGNDTLTANAGNDTLEGGAGDDTVNGGAGSDTASYSGATAAVTVSLAIAVTQNTAGAGVDTLTAIENLHGSAYADTLSGDASANRLAGASGNDTLAGAAGSDQLDGDGGTDTATYAASTGAVTANLATGLASDGLGGADLLADIENLIGSNQGDALTGDALNNLLLGGAGNDTLLGGDGNDTLNGGAGNDQLNGGLGDNQAIYSGASSGYSLNLVGGNLVVTDTDSANGSDGVDTLLPSIESVTLGAELLRLSGEFRVNTNRYDDQLFVSVASMPGGGFVAAWESGSQDGSGYGIYAQRYGASGAALGGEFKVNTTTGGDQRGPAVAALSDGGFVAVWHSYQQDGSSDGVYAQRYGSNGAPVGAEFRANSTTVDDQSDAVVAALSDGGYLVAWHSASQDGSSYGVYAQRYGASGVALGGEFKVNTSTLNEQSWPAVAALAGGGFMLVWQSYLQDGGSYGIYAQRYDASGAASGGEFQVNSTTADIQSDPAVAALAGGAGYVVAWHSNQQDGSGYGVYARRFDAAGVAQGAEFRVNSQTLNSQQAPVVAALAGGGFVVAWEDSASDGSSYGVYAQRYDAGGAAQGGEIRANSYTSSVQDNPSIAALADGGFVLTWISYQDGSYYGVYAQRFDASGNKVLNQVTGDTAANTLTWTHAGGVALNGLGGNDTLVSNSGDDTLDGGAGNDSLNGGAGNDTALYDSAGGAVTVSLAIAGAQNTVSAGSDTLAGIENLRGGDATDTLTGDANANRLSGVLGNDSLAGGAGDDTLDGAGGTDQVSYSASTGAVTANLSSGAASDGLGGSDLLLEIENLIGSNQGDALTGDAGPNLLMGGVGNDTLVGADGNDTLNGGAGNDLLNGGAGDNLAVYAGTSSGYSLNLVGGNLVVTDTDSSNGSEGVDTLLPSIESVAFSAELLRADGEFRVNTSTADDQSTSAVAALPGGGFVLAWQSYLQDGSGWGVYAQRYGADGTAQGGEFRVNQFTANDQGEVAIAALAGGDFVLAWHSNLQDGSSYGIYAQRFDANGAALGTEYRVNSATANEQSAPTIAALADGGFVLAWWSYLQDGSNFGVYAQRFDANGQPAGLEFRANSTTSSEQSAPAVAALAAGGFMLAWQSYGQDGSYDGIYAQRYDAAGAPAGGEFQVNSTTLDYQSGPALAALANSPGYVVAWHSLNQDGSGYGVYAQRYDAAGLAQGGEFRVNSSTVNSQAAPVIAALAGGGFVVAWQDNAQDGSSYGVYAQRYGADGTPGGGEFRINSTTYSTQYLPSIAALADGGFVASWSSFQDGSGYGVYAQCYDAAGNKVLNQITGDANANSLIWTQAGAVALSGAAGNDTLVSNAGNDTLEGGAGDDSINGGAGLDTASYENATAAVTVSLASAVAQNTGGAGVDTLAAMERLRGGYYNDNLSGNGSANLLTGASGNDTLAGGAGNDTLDGSGGQDSADYGASTAAVLADLQSGLASDGLGGSDSLLNLENISGSNQADTLSGDAGSNRLDGQAGSDSLDGRAGDDVIGGQSGDDTLIGGDGDDSLTGGAGNDTLDGGTGANVAYFGAASSGYSLGLSNGHLVMTDTDSSNGAEGVDLLLGGFDGLIFNNIELLSASGEMRVNTQTYDYQVAPSVAALPGGGFVVVWESYGQDGSGYGVYAQRYGANGVAQAGEFRVNGTTLNDQGAAVVAALAGNAGFVVAWQSYVQDGSGYGIYAQRYDANGVAQGAEFRVNSATSSDQGMPSLVALAGGGFLVAWESYLQDGSSYGVYAQRFDASGVAVGSEFKANTSTANSQDSPAIAAQPGGGFLLAWQSYLQDGGLYGIYAQRYDANGATAGGEFQVNSSAAETQSAPVVAALAGGAGFVVAWQSNLQDGSGYGVYAQRYDASGVAQGAEFRVNDTANNVQQAPAITALAGGGFVVAWEDSAQDGSGWGVYLQRFNAAGLAQGGELRGNTYTYSTQSDPSIAALADGGFVLTWNSYQDASLYGIYAQRFDAQGNRVLNQVTGDAQANRLVWTDAGGVGLTGLGGNDTLVSNSGDDTLDGGPGNDSLNGGAGNDIALYDGIGGAVTVSLALSGVQNTVSAGSDTLTGIENLRGGDYADTLGGDANANRLTGGLGNDSLQGLAGNDTLDGGGDADTVSYALSSGAVTANLASGTANDGQGGTDLLIGVEHLSGSAQGDTLIGDAGNNTLSGLAGADSLDSGAGNDSLVGGDGNDTLLGGDGNDTLSGGAGDDLIDGGAGVNTLIYSGPSSGYSLNLVDGNIVVIDTDSSNGSDGSDVLLGNFESVGFAGGAEVMRANGEFRVNTSTTYDQQAVALSALADGGFVAVWDSYLQDASGNGVYAQRYSANGAARGAEFRVNATTSNAQEQATVAALPDGAFVIAWQSYVQDGSGYGVYAQRFDAGGEAVGGEFRVNSTVTNNQQAPAMVALAGGGFVVAWQDSAKDASSWGVYAQRYDANGALLGLESRLNTSTANEQSAPALAALADGGYVAVWQSSLQDGSGYGVYAQRLGPGGVAVGGEFKVNTSVANAQSAPSVATLANNAGFVVAWQSNLQDGNGYGVYAQRYGSDGTAQGAEFRVNSTTAGSQDAPTLAALAGGGFIVVWQDSLLDGSSSGVYAQRYGSDGAALGGEFRVNTTTANLQSSPSVAALADGGYVMSWQSYAQDGSGYGVYAQRYDAAGHKVLTQVSGDASANVLTWTQSSGIVLDGAAGNDTLTGGSGDDTLNGGAGNDAINGGAGSDWASYSGSAAVTVNLTIAGAQNTIGAGSDTLNAIENLLGGSGSDNLTGDGASNALSGAAGNDTLAGGDGADLLNGGEGNDSINGGLGADTFIGGGGFDTLFGNEGADLFIVDAAYASTAAGGADKDIYLLRPVNGNAAFTVTDFTAGFGGDRIDERTLLANSPAYIGEGGTDPGNPFDPALGFLRLTQSGLDTLVQWDRDGAAGADGWVTRITLANTSVSALRFGVDGNFMGPIIGTSGDDSLAGGEGTDVIIALAGNDTLDGAQGADLMRGGPGNDIYFVNEYGDIALEVNNTAATGLPLADHLAIYAGVSDTVKSTINFTLGAFLENLVLEGIANLSGAGNGLRNELTGNDGDNRIEGLADADTLSGGIGYDTLDGGAGIDSMLGGAGSDLYFVDDASDVVIEIDNQPAAGLPLATELGIYAGVSDTVNSTVNFTLGAFLENLVLSGVADLNATGNDLRNEVRGNEGDNMLSGLADIDTLDGGIGYDTLDGGAGADSMAGGAGNDLYFVTDLGDVVIELDNNAVLGLPLGTELGIYAGVSDTVNSTVNFTLGSFLENLVLSGLADVAGQGNELRNEMVGNNGANSLMGLADFDTLDGGIGYDTLDGGSGADSMLGGAGSDIYFVDDAGDLVVEINNTPAAGQPIGTELGIYAGVSDTVNSTVSFTLGAFLENVVLLGVTDLTASGNALRNEVIGNQGNNLLEGKDDIDTLDGGIGYDTLDGGLGADSMVGGAGSDRYIVDDASDLVVEVDNQPAVGIPLGTELGIYAGVSDTVESTVNFTLGAFLENLVLSGLGGLTGQGNALRNELQGNAGANNLLGMADIDTLLGGAGQDTLDGGVGADSLTGGTGDDRFVLAAGGGVDRITDFSDGDSIRVTGLAASLPVTAGDGSTLAQNRVQLASSGGITTLYFGLNATAGFDLSVQLTGSYNASQLRASGTDISFNHAPGVANAIANQTATEDSAFNFVVPVNAFADPDAGDTLSYSATKGDGSPLPAWLVFTAGTRTFSGTPLNANVGSFDVKVVATDGALATSSDTFTITVLNTNDAPAVTSGATGTVAENAPVNTVVYTAVGNDVDVGTTLAYSVSGTDAALFNINSTSGALTLKASANFEAKASYSLNVVASDGIASTPKAITVNVTNVNEAPTVTSGATGSVAENAANSTVVYTAVGSDVDAGTALSYSITGTDAALFNIDSTTGVLRLNASANFEAKANYSLNVVASDGTLSSAPRAVTVNVTNVNEAPSVISGATGTVAENAASSTVVYTVVGGDVDGATVLIYSIGGSDAALFDIDASSGALTLKAPADFEAKASYSLDVSASDGALTSAPLAISISVTDVYDPPGVLKEGTSGPDTLAGGVGNDTLNGLEGNDSLLGGIDNDILNGAAGNDTLDGGTGIDSMDGGDGADSFHVRDAGDLVVESNALAAGGNDTVFAYYGGYVLTTNVENGRILFSGTGGIAGNSGNNTLYAGAGNNNITGGLGQDTASYLYATSSITANLATAGAQATGGSGSDTFVGIENLTGSAFNDTLTGSAAANILDGGIGTDAMTGGDGADTYLVREATDSVNETNAAAAGGIDLVWSYLATYTLGSNVENGRILATGAADITGNTLNNTLYAGVGNNILTADTGVDTLSYAYMGAGVTANLTTGTASGGSGTDSFTGFENLTGSNFNDSITGDAGANILDGGLGVDTMVGGDGNDTYLIRNGGDTANEASATGGTSDIALVYYGGYTLTANVENGRIMAYTAANINGNSLNNLLIAGINNNAINGAAGTDTVSYLFATAAVTASLATSLASGGSGSDSFTSIENLTGSNFSDTLAGDGNANLITGGTGADSLTGGAGADIFDYNNEAESGINNTTWDRITDFQSGQGDKIDLSGIDASTAIAGNQAFQFLTSGATFNSATTFTAAQRLFFDTTAHVLYGNVDADAAAEFAIELVGVNALALSDLVA